MKRLFAAFAVTALAAATVAVAQTTPQTTADQPQQQQRPNQTTPPSDQSTGTSSEHSKADKQKLVNVCVAQVQVSNPGVPVKEITDFCDKQAKKTSPKD